MRILGLVEGDPETVLSGVPRFLFDALDKRFRVVGCVDYAPTGARRLELAARTFRRDRSKWRARFHTSRTAHRLLSRTLTARLLQNDVEYDLALQVHGWVCGQPRPYALFLDQTRLMAERGWPEWLPFARYERAEILRLEREMYLGARHIFGMGAPVRESLVGDYGVDIADVTTVGGGLVFDRFPRAEELPQRPRILFVGRDFKRKGGEFLLGAFARVRRELPAATLDIVGVRGDFGRGVTAHGLLDRDRLAELYARARVFCLPSCYEPYGLVLIEAMAHGVPCVGTSVQAIPEILDEGRAGMLVPPRDPERLAKALLELLRDHDVATKLAAAGRDFAARQLTWDRVVERMAPVLVALTHERGASADA